MDEPSLPMLAIGAGPAELRALPATGGAIAGLTWRGHSVLRPTPPSMASEVRACACYPLVPYSNRIRDAILHFAGRAHRLARNFGTHPHAIHGVGWQRAWSVERHTADTLQLALDHDAADAQARSAWPWPFRALHTLHVHDAGGCSTLQATLTLESRADEPFPFGLGWHPFFPKYEDTMLEFAAEAVWRNDATRLLLSREPVPPEWSFVDARVPGAAPLDNVFVHWTGTARLIQPALGMRVTLQADHACRDLVVYSPPQAAFVAVEPVTHETDAFNRAAAGAADTGMRILAPGQAFSCTMRLEIESLE